MQTKNKNNKKPAMTLAEILIVVAIVAIVGGVFLAMPRQDNTKTDKTRYYIAYSILERFVSEQMANEGQLSLNLTNPDGQSTFGDEVNKWLNVESSCDWIEGKCNKVAFNPTMTNAILTNGMYFDWQYYNTLDETNEEDEIIRKGVYFDIDGPDQGKNEVLKDRHYFVIYKNYNGKGIRIRPATDQTDISIDANNNTWIGFKVYKFKANGDIDIIKLDDNYDSAYHCYDNEEGNTCPNECEGGVCFIEALPPMKL